MTGSRLAQARTFARYVRGVPRFVRDHVDPETAAARIRYQLARREESFLATLRETVYEHPPSPYLPLLRAAGAELGDVERMVRSDGLDEALGHLYDEGVRVTHDEFKAGSSSFDSPRTPDSFSSTGGSRRASNVPQNFDARTYDSYQFALMAPAFGLTGRPVIVYRVIPPSGSGIGICLRQAKIGPPAERWFTPHAGGRDGESLKFALYTRATLMAARAGGVRMAAPEHCPPAEAGRITRLLAEWRADGRAALVDTQAALAVRICLAAADEGLDISGTFFRVGGEPLTEGKLRAIGDAGCRAVSQYTMAETLRIGAACADPQARNDHHLLTDKLAVLQRPKQLGGDGETIGAFVYTSLLPFAGKVMLNVESGDYGELVERDCGCPYGELGLTTHINDVRSYDKLTAEGNTFLGDDLLDLVDEVLPARFGGGPTDYQLVEEEVDGLPKVSVVVRPRVGEVDEGEVVAAVLDHLGAKQRNRLMTEVWRAGETLRVVRREPYATRPAGKILPLMVLDGDRALR